MPWICTPDFSGGCAKGVRSGPWFHPDFGDQPVPLTVTRRRPRPYQARPLVADWLAETL
jgi:hypothetical protein